MTNYFVIWILLAFFSITFVSNTDVNADDRYTSNEIDQLLTDLNDRITFLTKKSDLQEKKSDLQEKRSNLQEDLLKDINAEVEYLKELSKLQVIRTCEEMFRFGVNQSNYYFIDPDGPLIGQEPIRVFCRFKEDGVLTEIAHNSEEKIEVEHCHDPGCYSRKIIYEAHQDQIQALIDLSESCEQSIRYDCMLSPLMDEGVNYAFWMDKDGIEQIYWDGDISGEHLCACHYSEEGCVEESTLHNTCNCDSKIPQEIFDEGMITDTSALPISELRFGGLSYDLQKGFHTLGKLKCSGKAAVPKSNSCSALKQDGQFKSGYYNLKEEGANSKLVFCNMSSPGYYNENDEKFVESSEDHFEQVEKDIEDINTTIPNLPGKWSGGSYCFFANGACPTGFTKMEGFLNTLNRVGTSTAYSKNMNFGDSYIGSRGGTSNDYGELDFAVCCK